MRKYCYNPAVSMRRRRQAGTATIELVAVMLLFAAIIVLVFFFGWALKHKYQVIVASRYSAWMKTQTGSWPTEDRVNEVSFIDKATRVDVGGHSVHNETIDELVEAAEFIGGRPGDLADRMFEDHFPHGRGARVTANFEHQMLSKMKGIADPGKMGARHGREGVSWRRKNVSPWTCLRDAHWPEMDDALESMPVPADTMANMIRGLYLAHW